MLTYFEECALLIERIAGCQRIAAKAVREAGQHIAAGDLDAAKADLCRASADVGRGLIWQHTLEHAKKERR